MDRFALIPEAHLLLFKGGKILLLKRQNTGYEDGKYSVVAGHIEEGEGASGGMIREAREEAGLEIAKKDLRLCHIAHRKSTEERVSFFFTVERWDGEPSNREPDKCSDLSWFDVSSLPDNMVPYLRQVIEKVLRGEVYSEFGWNS